jgi:hypothetical protein
MVPTRIGLRMHLSDIDATLQRSIGRRVETAVRRGQPARRMCRDPYCRFLTRRSCRPLQPR